MLIRVQVSFCFFPVCTMVQLFFSPHLAPHWLLSPPVRSRGLWVRTPLVVAVAFRECAEHILLVEEVVLVVLTLLSVAHYLVCCCHLALRLDGKTVLSNSAVGQVYPHWSLIPYSALGHGCAAQARP